MEVRMKRMLQGMGGVLLALVLLVLVPHPAKAAGTYPVTIDTATITGDQVALTVSAASVPATDDGQYYIFAEGVYQDGVTGDLVAQTKAGTRAEVSFPLNFNTAQSNLCRKFLVVVRQGGSLVQVSEVHYLTNPEVIAVNKAVRNDHGIKGLLPDASRVGTGELQDLGIDQITYNISLGDIVGESTNAYYPTTYFNYDGQTYAFNTAMLEHYDYLFKVFNSLNLQLTINILNEKRAGALDLIHPLANDGYVSYGYAFNTAEEAGAKHLEAIAFFLGSRYSGAMGCGQVDNWIIGNEVNARTERHYCSSTDVNFNAKIYHDAFRIFYNGLKAGNGTCRVYNSIDQEWSRKSNPGCFLSREFLDLFNNYMLTCGNIDWGLSFHPYNSPLFDPYAWLGLTQWVHKDVTTPYITMQNLYILTDYMHQQQYLNPDGEVRSLSLSEIGYTSSFGSDLQCASIAYGYLQAAANPDVDGFLLYRQTDAPSEMSSHIAQGLVTTSGQHKEAYDFYKYIDTDQAAPYKQRASQIIGQDIDSLIGIRDFRTRTNLGYTP